MSHAHVFKSCTSKCLKSTVSGSIPPALFHFSGHVFPLLPYHPLLCQLFALAPIYALECKKLFVQEYLLCRLFGRLLNITQAFFKIFKYFLTLLKKVAKSSTEDCRKFFNIIGRFVNTGRRYLSDQGHCSCLKGGET